MLTRAAPLEFDPMPLTTLTSAEQQVVFECLRCIAEDNVVFPAWEFPTIFGIDLATFKQVYQRWPAVDDAQETTRLAINNAMNNLLGYPHAHHDTWAAVMPYSKERVTEVFDKWRNTSGVTPDAKPTAAQVKPAGRSRTKRRR